MRRPVQWSPCAICRADGAAGPKQTASGEPRQVPPAVTIDPSSARYIALGRPGDRRPSSIPSGVRCRRPGLGRCRLRSSILDLSSSPIWSVRSSSVHLTMDFLSLNWTLTCVLVHEDVALLILLAEANVDLVVVLSVVRLVLADRLEDELLGRLDLRDAVVAFFRRPQEASGLLLLLTALAGWSPCPAASATAVCRRLVKEPPDVTCLRAAGDVAELRSVAEPPLGPAAPSCG